MYVTFSWSYACQPMMAHWYNITTYCILYIQYWSTCHTRIYGSWMCGERQESNTRPQEHSVVVNAAILLFLQKYRFFFQWFAMSAYDCQSIFAWAMRVALAWSSVGAVRNAHRWLMNSCNNKSFQNCCFVFVSIDLDDVTRQITISSCQ